MDGSGSHPGKERDRRDRVAIIQTVESVGSVV